MYKVFDGNRAVFVRIFATYEAAYKFADDANYAYGAAKFWVVKDGEAPYMPFYQ